MAAAESRDDLLDDGDGGDEPKYTLGIHIVLSRDPLDTAAPGYQAPVPVE